MSHTKLGPTLAVDENENHESHAFWFEAFKCSVKVDRRKDGSALALTLKTPEGKVVISVGPENQPRFVTQVKYAKDWNDGCEFSSEVKKGAVKFRFDFEPLK